jgi:hypothetical protein
MQIEAENGPATAVGQTIRKESMKAFSVASLLCAATIGFAVQSSAHAEGQFHFPVGICYASGIQDATDKLFDFYKSDGFDVTRIDIPVGLTLNPYYEWNTSIGAIGAGVTVGPTAFVMVDEKTVSYYGSSSDTFKFSYAVPVGGFIRYTPWPKATVAPYVRGGVKYPFAGGDNLESSQVGPFGAVGIEFWRTKRIGMSIEVGYDASEIKVKYTGQYLLAGTRSQNVTFSGFTAGLSILF